MVSKSTCSFMLFLLVLCVCCFSKSSALATEGWPTYGGDEGGQRYSSLKQITPANVRQLAPVWEYHTGALKTGMPSVSRTDFEATPVLFDGTLYLATPFDRVIALDPARGTERWSFDPKLPTDLRAANYTSRGVATWAETDAKRRGGTCGERVYLATLDARLLALDAKEGSVCEDFGHHGVVDLKDGIAANPAKPFDFYGNTSPPTVVGDVIVVGSAVADNQAVDVESGAVRGFDARTGRKLWAWEPLPWAVRQTLRAGAGNAWSVLSADKEHGIVYVPTGSAAPDFYGAMRPGDNRDANSLVALEATTGRKLWAFQLVHHDVWDYDVAAQPLLFDFQGRPAVAVAAKTGVVFVLDRLTGAPLIPVTEKAVPRSDVPGEVLSPTQPFTNVVMNALTMDKGDLSGHEGEDAEECRAALKDLRYEGVFTPVSLQGTLQYPGSLGGVNWGSMSFDPVSGTLFANTNGSAYETRLVEGAEPSGGLLTHLVWVECAAVCLVLLGALNPYWRYTAPLTALIAILLISYSVHLRRPTKFTYQKRHNFVNSPDAVGEVSPNKGVRYRIYRRVLQDSKGRPCTPQPWGSTVAVNVADGRVVWRKPLGTAIAGQRTGAVGFGAPIVTAGGLLFTAASTDPLLRAIDERSGEEIWSGRLPVPAQSTPMTYLYEGKQYVVVCAGGHGGLGIPLGDSVVAFALKKSM